MAEGMLVPGECADTLRAVAEQARLVDLDALERRIATLEQRAS
jgi:hypothetical protein